VTANAFSADAINETLSRTAAGKLKQGDSVNLELAMKADGRFGGHIVQGHVDGVGEIASVRPDGLSQVVTVSAAPEILRYIVEKGSITVDGISLTVARIDAVGFDIALIPETLERTTLGSAQPGDVVNLETDIFAKYAEKLAG
jgi:riboflavin synthase